MKGKNRKVDKWANSKRKPRKGHYKSLWKAKATRYFLHQSLTEKYLRNENRSSEEEERM